MHKLFHRLMRCWENIETLPVPGYARLTRQRCTVCQDTRVQAS